MGCDGRFCSCASIVADRRSSADATPLDPRPSAVPGGMRPSRAPQPRIRRAIPQCVPTAALASPTQRILDSMIDPLLPRLGVLSTRELGSLGWSRHDIDAALASGALAGALPRVSL